MLCPQPTVDPKVNIQKENNLLLTFYNRKKKCLLLLCNKELLKMRFIFSIKILDIALEKNIK